MRLKILRQFSRLTASLSVSQYESYFREHKHSKNLKKKEWRAVHTKLDELSAKGVKARVKVSGVVFDDKRKLDRSKRHAFSGLDPSQAYSEGRPLIYILEYMLTVCEGLLFPLLAVFLLKLLERTTNGQFVLTTIWWRT